ncbi:MAG: cupin domain-containing protein [Burkholderiales bacterium]|nr:cupin domain-containing protein [Betaproteobacteria bacterium]
MSSNEWSVFTLDELARRVKGKEARFIEFLHTPSLSCAIYHLPAGSRDMQAPHLEDEVYLVVSGRARLKVAGAQQQVSAGTILYVRATSEHSFFDIEEDLTLVAIFGATGRL